MSTRTLAAMLLLACGAAGAPAATIMVPSLVAGPLGSTIDVPVQILGLDVAAGLGGFHFTFTWSSGLIDWAADGPVYFNALGAGGQVVLLSTDSRPDHDVTAVSLLSPDELRVIQQPDMLLLILPLVIKSPVPPAGAPGELLLRQIAVAGELTDALGNPIEVTFVTPEPSAGFALAAGSGLLLWLRRRRRARA